MGTSGDAGHRRGVFLANRGRYVEARRVLAEAAEAARRQGDVNLLARITGTTAYVLARMGDVETGERLLLDMLEGNSLDEVTVAQLHGQLGALALERGLLDEASEWLTKGERGLRSEPVRRANLLMNRSLVEMDRGRLDTAADDLRDAEAAYRAAGMLDEANQAVHNRGYLAMRQGDLVTALTIMRSVREPLDDESDMWAAINELDHAEVLRDAGLVTEAERLLASAAAVLGRRRAPRERAAAEYQLARSLLSHAPERAAHVAAAAARRFRALRSDGWAVRADAIRLRGRLAVGRIDRSGRAVSVPARLPSERTVQTTVAELRGHGFIAEAEALRLTDELARARRGLKTPSGPVRIPPRMPLEVQLLAYELRAVRASAQGKGALARRHAAAGLAVLDRSRRDFGSLDLQTSAAMRSTGLMGAAVASALDSGRIDVAFEWSERARLSHQHVLPLRPPPDPALAADLAELRAIRSAAPDGNWLADPRAATLHDRTRARQWAATAGADATERISLDEAQASLRSGEAMISFVFDGARLAALVAQPGDAVLVPLAWPAIRAALDGLRADLDVVASITRGPMAAVVRRARDDRLARLSDLLVAPIASHLSGVDRVVILAPGALAGLPWSMLRGFEGRALTVASAASTWARARTRGPLALRRAGFALGPRIPRGVEEIETASRRWETADVLRGGQTTVAEVTRLASRVDLLHIAAHGRHAVDNPMFSGIEFEDGTLFGYDIDLVHKVPDAVVLSSCEVGRSAVRWGEEAVGMVRIWLHAGTRCVIAAPVVVADDDACELLGAMHDGLARGVSPAEALAAASVRTGIVAPFQVHGVGF